MGRFLVDVPADDVRKLDEIAKREGKSRAAVLREAVSNYLEASGKEGFEKYFGLWERHGSTVDGLEYERQLREEWPDVGGLMPTKANRDAA
jgi:Ribbon-helix-helix protein, copG family